jgi:NADH-quinone oxidoreductase subunit K
MEHTTLAHHLLLAGLLFALGLTGVLVRRNLLVVYMCLELMLAATTLAMVAFSRFAHKMDGAVFYVITVAAAEVAVGLALIVALYRRRGTIQSDALNLLRD